MSQIVLRNLDCAQAEEQLAEVLNTDEVIGGFDLNLSIKNSNTNIRTESNIIARNILKIETDLPSLTAINQLAG